MWPAVRAEDLDCSRCLLRTAELELFDRERRATERRIERAKVPITKSLDSFDFLAVPTLNKTMVLELAVRVPHAQRERIAARQLRHGQDAHRDGAWFCHSQ